MARVVHGHQFVTVKSVLVVSECVQEDQATAISTRMPRSLAVAPCQILGRGIGGSHADLALATSGIVLL